MNLLQKLKRKIYKITHPIVGEIWCLHRVVPRRSDFKRNRELEITPDYLEQLIQQYLGNGSKFTDIDTVIKNISHYGMPRKHKLVNISFDDGFQDVYTYAYPILKKYNIPFTIYLTTDFPDKKADLWWLKLEQIVEDNDQYEQVCEQIYTSRENMLDAFKQYVEESGYQAEDKIDEWALSWNQIKEMVESGLCTIGSHTKTHPGLTKISDVDCVSELQESAEIISGYIGERPMHFSYPHSFYSKQVTDNVRRAKYISATIGYGGVIRMGDNPYMLNRNYIVQLDDKSE